MTKGMSKELLELTEGGGEMGKLIRELDWSQSPVGSFEKWPQSLKTSLSICLGSKFPMFVWWGRDLTVFYNDSYIPFTGMKHPKYLGRPAREQWAEIWDALKPLTEQVLETGRATWAESMQLFMTRKGFLEETYFTFSYSPIRDESGNVGGIINPCQETTERILSQRRLKTLHDLTGIEVKNISEIGEKAAQILGGNVYDIPFALLYATSPKKPEMALIGATGVQRFSSIAPRTLKEPWRGSQRKIDGLRPRFSNELPKTPYDEKADSAYVFPIQVPHRETPVGYLVLGISPRLNFDASYLEFFSLVCKGITTHFSNVIALDEERKRTEALAEVDRLKTQFLSNVSHELRTPLTLILAPLESILINQNNIPIQEELRQFLNSAYNNSIRLLQMVNGLLDFSKFQLGKIEVSREPVDIDLLTQTIFKDFSHIMKTKDIQAHLDCRTPIGTVSIDRYLYERILFNLLSNATKFTPKGGSITLKLVHDGECLLFSVQDTGIGIAKSDFDKLFQRFQQIEGSATRRFEGTGLGLSLVKEFAQLLGGTVSVESEVGKGSCFSVKCLAPRSGQKPVELARTVRAIIAPPQPNAASSKTPSHQKMPKVLIAEDNSELALFIQSLLQNMCTTHISPNGKEALQVAREWKPDLILSDVMMPEMDGISLCREIKSHKETCNIPVVLLTALTHREALLKGWEEGADDYLFKPFHPTELAARVRSLLNLSHTRKERDTEMTMRRDLEEFAYLASHDIREPLRVIRLYVDLLREAELHKENTPPEEDIKQTISKNAERAQTLIDDLIQYSVLKKKDSSYEVVDCNQVVQQALANLENLIADTKAEIRCENLPKIVSNRSRLVQVFQNLVQNAIKYRKEAPPQITIQGKCIDQEWVITVKDNGIGFDQKYADHIFLVFKRLHHRDKYEGNGMGLAICKSIITGLGGRIWAQSQKGEGALFNIALPRSAEGKNDHQRT